MMVGRLLSFLFRARRIFRGNLAVKFPGCPRSQIFQLDQHAKAKIEDIPSNFIGWTSSVFVAFALPDIYFIATWLAGLEHVSQVAECPRNWCLPTIMVQ